MTKDYEALMQELDPDENVPQHHLAELNKGLDEINGDSKLITKLADRLLEENNQMFYLLPFDHTLEAEGFGAEVYFDRRFGSRVRETPYKTVENLERIAPLNLANQRLLAVLEAADLLKARKMPICFNITGPVSVLEQLIGSELFFESLKQPALLRKALGVMEKGIIDLLEKIIALEVEVISYADPTGDRSIFGPRVFDKHFGASNYKILETAEEKLAESRTVFHVHPALAASFLENGWMVVERTFLSEFSYPESILDMKSQHPSIVFISRLKEESLIQLTLKK